MNQEQTDAIEQLARDLWGGDDPPADLKNAIAQLCAEIEADLEADIR
jgi:hypothetical protein